MKESTLEKELKKPVELKKMYVTESTSTIKYSEAVSRFIGDLSVPTTKDGKPDISALINKIVAGIEPIVAKHFGDGKDPRWVLNTAQLQALLDTYENPVEGGKLREAVRTRLANEYRGAAETYSNERGVGRGLTIPQGEGTNYGKIVAQETNPAFVGVFNRAKTPEQLQRGLGLVLPRLLANTREAYEITGKIPTDMVKSAKHYSQTYKS